MKIKIFVLTIMTLLSTQLVAKTLVISDVDDTIKMTAVLSGKAVMTFNGLVRKKAFAGMSELYQELKNQDFTIFYVSGSPKIIKSRVSEFLNENNFPQIDNLILLRRLSDDTIKFKEKSIKELIRTHNPDKLILIGDDTQHDPEIYDNIQSLYPELVDSIYIRSVANRELPKNELIKTYFSAVEIAGHQMIKGNLNALSLKKVVRGFIGQTNKSGVSLKRSYCPREGRNEIEVIKYLIEDLSVIDALDRTQDKIIANCN